MTDVVVLLAISQLICLGGLCYLVRQIFALKGEVADAVDMVSAPDEAHPPVEAFAPATEPAPAGSSPEVAALVRRMEELGLDIPALARRMRRSEQEVRMLLNDYGVRQ